ncbi:hypothetical protein ColTof4_07086 [Colletotrichum tofieldiae]|nr:hypothetical protein ColTof3_12030 [Colletotrichum tofieldiae]GKT74663.1 hypothetical protein ColTof4_07086 [Colletotrichum tofieldiae]
MPPLEPPPSEDAIQPTLHEAMQHREKQDDNEIGQQQPQSGQSVPETAKDTAQPPAAGSSAQGPIASSKKWTVQRFWSKHVSVVVDFETCRDHLGT